MKKFILLISVFLCFYASAQDRVNTPPAKLSWKSKELKRATFWIQKKGSWKRWKNNARPYQGEGIYTHNFNSLFLGEYSGVRYLFCDTFDYKWKYPNLELEWCVYRDIYAFPLSEEDFTRLQNIHPGEVVSIGPQSYVWMFMGNEDYTFSYFLKLTKLMLSSSIADKGRYAIVAKRTISKNKDVVRFLVPPHAFPINIDLWYYEVSYHDFMKLFISDKKNTYKI